MTPKPFDRMSLAFLASAEARLLVAAWPLLPRHLRGRARDREWAKLANVRTAAVKLYARQLIESRILLEDGTVVEDARTLIAGTTIHQLAPGAAKGRR